MKKSKKFNLAEKCQEAAPDIIEKLKAIINMPGPRHSKVKMSAMRELLDRGFGKPSEKVIIEEHKILID